MENDNLDSSQKNVVFLASGEKASQCIAIAGMYVLEFYVSFPIFQIFLSITTAFLRVFGNFRAVTTGQKVDCVDSFQLYLISLEPKMIQA